MIPPSGTAADLEMVTYLVFRRVKQQCERGRAGRVRHDPPPVLLRAPRPRFYP